MARGRRITAPPSAIRADWGSVNVDRDIHRHIHHRKPAVLLGPVNVMNVVNVYPHLPSRVRARPYTRKGRKNIHNIHRETKFPASLER